jgi:hypothetical protein
MGIQELKKDLALFTTKGKEIVHAESDDYKAMKALLVLWNSIFHGKLDTDSAKGFVAHFRQGKGGKKVRKSRKQRGGAAPIAYQMGPGVPSASTYGHFTTDVSTDTRSQHDLDVYFNSGMSRTAGTETWRFPTVPAGMGSNQVGGRRRRTRKQRGGGSLLETIGQLPFQAAAPPTAVQTAYAAYSGQPSAPSSDPTSPAWSYSNNRSAIDPASVTRIGSSINQLVTPSPWR